MRSRTRRKNNTVSQNLDSFLDVLTNTVGVLMFVSLFLTLVSTGSGGGNSKTKVTIQTPLSSPTEKQSLWFEIKNNKVSYLNLRKVRELELELTENLPNCNKPQSAADVANYQSCLLSVLGRQSNFEASTENYEVSAVDDGVSLEFKPVSEQIGETTTQLAATDSQFKRVLSQYNSKKDYLVFVVRPDSFETFRAARKVAWAANYEVGWEPHPLSSPIKIRTLLGSELPGGKSIGVQ